MPEFKNGEQALRDYLHVTGFSNKGKVYIQFIIDSHGQVTKPRIIRGLDPECDKKAIELVESLPDWIPGEQRGHEVNVQKTYPVIFE